MERIKFLITLIFLIIGLIIGFISTIDETDAFTSQDISFPPIEY